MMTVGASVRSSLKQAGSWFIAHEIWPLAIGSLLASATLSLAPWGLGMLALIFCGRWAVGKRLSVRTPWDWPVGLLLCMIPVTLAVTIDRDATFLAVSRLLAMLALAYGIANWARREADFILLWSGLIVMGIVLAAAGLIGMEWPLASKGALHGGIYHTIPHPSGDLLNPNMVAGGLVMIFPFALAGLFWWRSWVSPLQLVRQVFVGIATLLVVVTLWLTQSRGGWLAAAVILVLMGNARSKVFFRVTLVLMLVATGWLILNGRFLELWSRLGGGDSISGWPERVEIWSRALYMIRDFSFTGVGADTYPKLLNLLYPLFLIDPTREIPHAHNLLLQVAVDLGLPGLIAFGAILVLVFYGAGRIISCAEESPLGIGKPLAWACLLSFTGMLVHGFLDATTWIVGWVALLPGTVLGLIMALTLSALQSGEFFRNEKGGNAGAR